MNTFQRKSLYAAVAAVSALGATTAVEAVNLNPDGLGQALIYPYYTVRNDGAGNAYDSLLSVVNSTSSVKAVKVRFLEGKNSLEVLDFNLFLSANDVWTGAISANPGGGARLTTADRSCTLPAIPAAGVVFRNTLLGADGAGAGLDRTTEGYVEIIEMGTYDEESVTAERVTHDPPGGTPPSCNLLSDSVAAAEIDGIEGGLFGGMTLINVASGTDFSMDAVALDNFATGLTLYTGAQNTDPTLANVFPKSSVVIADFGLVFASNWSFAGANQADPVSAVLMQDQVMNEFVLDVETQSGTDWVLTMPTKRFYVIAPSSAPASRLFQNNFNRTVGACDDVSLTIFDREERTTTTDVDFSPAPPAGRNALCWEANVITFNNTNVLGSANSTNIDAAGLAGGAFRNGWLTVGFFPSTVTGATHTLPNPATTFLDPTVSPPFVSAAGTATYLGLPVVGFAAHSYRNAQLQGGNVLSNYGGTFKHKGTRFVATPLLQAND